jgi:hypothetical protein
MVDRPVKDKDSEAPSASVPPKKPYTAPVLQHWGTFKDVTRTNGQSGNSDGGRKGQNRTH